MPSFYGWCDICVDFYPISRDEWAKQLVESAQIALSDYPKTAQVGKQLCPDCKKKIAASKSKRPCREASARKKKR
jgi:hypothetical protein